MSLGDEYESTGGYGGSGQTRTRMPDSGGPHGGGRRGGGRTSSRSLVTVVGVVVLLIAAIAFANRGGGDSASGEGDDSPKAEATAPSGEKPVRSVNAGIPSGFARDRQGAESAAANYAVALGSAEMFNKGKRDAILNSVLVPARVADFGATLDKAYTPEFNQNVGLNEDGTTPEGYTFVSRTSPMGTKVIEASDNAATVEVWCSGLLGLAGESSTNPVINSWFTITVQLEWTNGDWKIVTHSQKDGPTPVPGDERASSAEEMAKAVEEYGGFTYAR
ncbi:hypothetical protein [Streptomyces sp. KMM 9044]|uniref:hypothetical protein n=1 Tax=Streptomyces sp. KMM 9044 TaxID=2744474 RepID=UPI002150E754|nr:hypothetical protein [Streptomyces sp. KMM 9044]WAX79270.1 hypothetical protein HUV60_017990 [Streptomyces sp. KMM 9044]